MTILEKKNMKGEKLTIIMTWHIEIFLLAIIRILINDIIICQIQIQEFSWTNLSYIIETILDKYI